MAMLLNDFLDNPEYLRTTTGNTTYGEKLCCSILNHPVSDTIHRSIIHFCPRSAVYEHLKSHYNILTWASQVLLWTNLLSLQMKDEESTTVLVYRLWIKVRNFKNMHVSFREDHVLGILSKHTTCSQPSISNLVMGKLEAIVSTYSQPPNLGQFIAEIKSSSQQVKSQKKMAMPDKTDLLTFKKLNVADNDNTVEMGNDKFSEGLIDPKALHVMIWGTCHLCKQQGHFSRNCPKNTRKPQEQSKNVNMFRKYYPIIAP
ncbi:hypothetical protein O181_005900 [Austropuccinia psidii MF-1]|uniref:CCHC-type domain-containing protein n=1 Tax=Austropuccinia psidii MF-1 TaxID=1389203 RepID=A0A9Q3BJW1_9BASI|nr:hypothetical protein [Austropuccinia psidii MF-1]